MPCLLPWLHLKCKSFSLRACSSGLNKHLARDRIFSTPSTSVQFKPFSNDFALDQNAPGYRYIRLKRW